MKNLSFKKMSTLQKQDGFTIVELMIALSILSTLLVTSTLVLTQIGSLYTKGVNAAALQDVTRTTMADVTGVIKFSGAKVQTIAADPVSKVAAICVGTTRYSFVLNKELGTDDFAPNGSGGTSSVTTPHVLWRDTVAPGTCDIRDIRSTSTLTGGYEMLGEHMRLTKFNVAESNGTVKVEIFAAYGDSDLLTTDTTTGHSTCKGSTGQQFCGVSELSTTVAQRLSK